MIKTLAAVLIVLGILGFVFGGFSFTTGEKVVDLGPVEVNREKTKTFPIAPVASGLALGAGVVLLIASFRKA